MIWYSRHITAIVSSLCMQNEHEPARLSGIAVCPPLWGKLTQQMVNLIHHWVMFSTYRGMIATIVNCLHVISGRKRRIAILVTANWGCHRVGIILGLPYILKLPYFVYNCIFFYFFFLGITGVKLLLLLFKLLITIYYFFFCYMRFFDQ